MNMDNNENNMQPFVQQDMMEEQSRSEKKSFRTGIVFGILGTMLLLSILFVCVIAFKGYYNMMRYSSKASASEGISKEQLLNDDVEEKMEILQDTINKYYLEGISVEELEEGVYRGMLEALDDPYSVYYTADELRELQQQSEGIYYGVGAYVGMDLKSGYAQFSKIIKDTPAEAAGLMEGDYIYMVNDEDMQGQELSYVVSKIKGEEGTMVKLTILRDGSSEPLIFEVERKKIESPTVNYEMYDNQIAYIQITEFDSVTEQQFKDAYAEAQAQGMKGLIIDLRSNPGGNLDTVVQIARCILPKGMIVYTEDKYGERAEYTCDGKNEIQVPLVVLVNGYSASASEILAGAVKDYGIGTLVGTTTYGKGIVQKVISLSDGSAVKLTVSKYYTPNGNNIHKIGIEPDVEVEFDAEQYQQKDYDNQLEEAKKILQGEIQ